MEMEGAIHIIERQMSELRKRIEQLEQQGSKLTKLRRYLEAERFSDDELNELNNEAAKDVARITTTAMDFALATLDKLDEGDNQ